MLVQLIQQRPPVPVTALDLIDHALHSAGCGVGEVADTVWCDAGRGRLNGLLVGLDHFDDDKRNHPTHHQEEQKHDAPAQGTTHMQQLTIIAVSG